MLSVVMSVTQLGSLAAVAYRHDVPRCSRRR